MTHMLQHTSVTITIKLDELSEIPQYDKYIVLNNITLFT